MYFTYREHSETFEHVGLWTIVGLAATGTPEPEQVLAAQVTHGTLNALGVQPLLGRWFAEEDDAPGASETVILTHGYWQRALGGDRNVLGNVLQLDDQPYEIVGVLPETFRFPAASQPQLFVPMQLDREAVFLGEFRYNGVARLKPKVTLAQANRDVERMLGIWLNAWPPFPGLDVELFRNARFAPDVTPLKSDVVGPIGDRLWILMGALGLVLVIVCANVANLMMVRTDGRRQELALRTALGAGWGRLGRELLTESAVLSFAGAVLGLFFASAGLRALLAYAGNDLPRTDEIAIDPRALLFAMAVTGLTALLIGLWPLAKYARPQIAGGLQGTGRTVGQSRVRHRTRNVLVAGQVALAVVLLVGSGLMVRTFVSLRGVEPGFTEPAHVQMFRLTIRPTQVRESQRVMRMHQEVLERLAALPGVESAALVSSSPLEGLSNINPVYVRDRMYAEDELPPLRRYKFVSPGAFEALGVPVLAGRDFSWTELYDRRPVAIVSAGLARELWGSATSAIGRFIRPLPEAAWKEIVGVVGDVADAGIDQPAPAIAYWPAYNEGFFGPATAVQRSGTYLVRSPRAGTKAFVEELRQAVWSISPGLPLANVRTLDDLHQASTARTSYTLVLLAIAGTVALLLGVVGIYGVVAYAVAQRTREVGIRMALGANARGVQGIFVRQALLPVGVGAVLGLAAAAATTRLMSSLLFGVKALDPGTYAVVIAVVGTAALVAAYLPARRATRIEPLAALRAD
jgi:predicted permease